MGARPGSSYCTLFSWLGGTREGFDAGVTLRGFDQPLPLSANATAMWILAGSLGLRYLVLHTEVGGARNHRW